MNSKSARSSCRITGTSSTSCGSACSPSSTSSTSQGTASELDQRLVPTPGRRLRHAHLPACRTGQRDRRVVLLALRRRRVDRPVHRHLPHPLVRGQRVSWISAWCRRPAAGYATRTCPPAEQVSAIVVSYYWHFVDVVWIGLFTVIYLIH